MSKIFAKLNLTTQRQIVVLNAPESFQSELAQLTNIQICRERTDLSHTSFALVFVSKKNEVNDISVSIAEKTKGDAIVWLAYPKGTSKKYKADFNRDNGWSVITQLGFDTVRQISIDDDWTALRFRRVEFIGSR